MCGQVWWPILGICPLHLTHPSAHSQQWTYTRSSGQPCCGARGAVGGSVPCSRVSPQSWYWRWREHLLFAPPTDNPCRTWESNLQPLGYKSNSLTIRPRLPSYLANQKSYLLSNEEENAQTFLNRDLWLILAILCDFSSGQSISFLYDFTDVLNVMELRQTIQDPKQNQTPHDSIIT